MAAYIDLDIIYNIMLDPGFEGSCDSYLEKLEASYTDALMRAETTINAFNEMRTGRTTNWIKDTRNNRKVKTL